MDQKDKPYSPILPYDITYGENYHIYNEMKYQQDKSLCPEDSIRMTSGNVYKYYAQTPSDAYKVGGN